MTSSWHKADWFTFARQVRLKLAVAEIPVPTYLISISPQATGSDRRESGKVIAVFAADPASALRKAERTLRGAARLADLQCLGAVELPVESDRRVFKRRAADCH